MHVKSGRGIALTRSARRQFAQQRALIGNARNFFATHEIENLISRVIVPRRDYSPEILCEMNRRLLAKNAKQRDRICFHFAVAINTRISVIAFHVVVTRDSTLCLSVRHRDQTLVAFDAKSDTQRCATPKLLN